MVETVRCTLSIGRTLSGKVLAWGGVGLVFFPVLPGLGFMLQPILSGQNWAFFWHDGQWLPAMLATLVSSVIGSLGALLLCLLVVLGLYPGTKWRRYQRKLPALLALPHVAFAAGSLLLFTSTGWLVRLMTATGLFTMARGVEGTHDPYGVGLGLTLALKESWFLLWVAGAQLKRTDLQPQLLVMRSLGYGRLQSSWLVLIPQLLPSLGWAIVAVLAYNISVVDVAIILGPGNPPTLAVLSWQWLTGSTPQIQAKGMIAAFLLIVLLAVLALAGYLMWQGLSRCLFPHSGRRYLAASTRPLSWLAGMMTVIGLMVLLMLLVWSLAGIWFYPALLPQGWSLTAWQDRKKH
jgi:putative thiamine transport system permease protein